MHPEAKSQGSAQTPRANASGCHRQGNPGQAACPLQALHPHTCPVWGLPDCVPHLPQAPASPTPPPGPAAATRLTGEHPREAMLSFHPEDTLGSLSFSGPDTSARTVTCGAKSSHTTQSRLGCRHTRRTGKTIGSSPVASGFYWLHGGTGVQGTLMQTQRTQPRSPQQAGAAAPGADRPEAEAASCVHLGS